MFPLSALTNHFVPTFQYSQLCLKSVIGLKTSGLNEIATVKLFSGYYNKNNSVNDASNIVIAIVLALLFLILKSSHTILFILFY